MCDHSGWGQYPGEEGECPPPAEMVEIENGLQCPTCKSSMQVRHASVRETAMLRDHYQKR